MKAIRILGVVVLVLMLVGLVLGTACAGTKGEQGPKGGFGWANTENSTRTESNFSYEAGAFVFTHPGDMVKFTFTASGSSVKYWVTVGMGSGATPYYWIIDGNHGDPVQSGGGSFIATETTYYVHYEPTGINPLSTVVTKFTVYTNN